MQETPEQDAWKVARSLLERYGEFARLEAALSAHRALREVDLGSCQFWKTVLDILENDLHIGKSSTRISRILGP